MKFSLKQFIVPNFWKRFFVMFPAVLMMGFFLSFLIEVGWGTDPASYANLNIASALHLSLGNTQVIVYSILLVFTIIFGSDLIGFGTLSNMILIGYVADFFRWVWEKSGFHAFVQEGSLFVHLLVFIPAIIGFVIVAALYINSEMGVAPYDAAPIILSRFFKKIPSTIIRICFDLSAVLIGVIAGSLSEGGMQGSAIGSVVMSLLLGPVITFVGKKLKFK